MKLTNRFLSVLLAFLLTLLPAGAVLAEDASAAPEAELQQLEPEKALPPLSLLFHAMDAVLSVEPNVTLEGEGDFYLDDLLFKHAEGVLAQEGTNAYQQIDLRTPRADGTFRENGYAVVDLGGKGYSVERYNESTFVQPVGNAPKEHPLRPSVKSEMLRGLGRSIAGTLDQLWQDQLSVSRTETGMIIHLVSSEAQVPALFDAGMNLAYQALVEHFFELNYQDMSVDGYADIHDYMTTLEGIIYCTRSLRLQEVDLTAEVDAADRFKRMEGTATFLLTCRDESEHPLHLRFTLSARDYGSTRMPEMVPEKNRLDFLSTSALEGTDFDAFFETNASRGISWSELGLTDIPLPQDRLLHRTISSPEEAMDYAREICGMDALGLEEPLQLSWAVDREGDQFDVLGYSPDAPEKVRLRLAFDTQGNVLRFKNNQTHLEEAVPAEWNEESDSDMITEWRSELDLMLWLFTESINPGSTMLSASQLKESLWERGIGFSGYHETLESGDETFLIFYGILHQDPTQKVKFIVQTAPVCRVILMDTTVDPEEGGNG